jgi:hypothetical protein
MSESEYQLLQPMGGHSDSSGLWMVQTGQSATGLQR